MSGRNIAWGAFPDMMGEFVMKRDTSTIPSGSAATVNIDDGTATYHSILMWLDTGDDPMHFSFDGSDATTSLPRLEAGDVLKLHFVKPIATFSGYGTGASVHVNWIAWN